MWRASLYRGNFAKLNRGNESLRVELFRGRSTLFRGRGTLSPEPPGILRFWGLLQQSFS